MIISGESYLLPLYTIPSINSYLAARECGVAIRHQNNIPDELLDHESKYKFRSVGTVISMLIIYHISSNVQSVTPFLNWRRDLFIYSYLVIMFFIVYLIAFSDWCEKFFGPKRLVCLTLIGYALQADL